MKTHLQHLQRLPSWGLFNREKCECEAKQLDFLGHRLSVEGSRGYVSTPVEDGRPIGAPSVANFWQTLPASPEEKKIRKISATEEKEFGPQVFFPFLKEFGLKKHIIFVCGSGK
jgi:hypothetical protein